MAGAAPVKAVETLDVGQAWRKYITSEKILGDILPPAPSCHTDHCLPGSEDISHHMLPPWCSAQEMIHHGLNPLKQEWSKDKLPYVVSVRYADCGDV